MKRTKRKTRSDKFPLTLHPTGQYCKNIKGKIRYFGTDKKKALERYLAQATYLHGAQSLLQKASNGKMTLKQLCGLYLQYQHSRVLAGVPTPKHYSDQIRSLNRLAKPISVTLVRPNLVKRIRAVQEGLLHFSTTSLWLHLSTDFNR